MPYEIKNLNKRYDDNVVLQDVSLCLEEKKIHGLVGYNGSGKSTLGKILAGVIQKDSGQLILDKHEIRRWDVKEAIQSGIFLADYHSTMIPELTVIENMLYGLNCRKDNSFLKIVFNQRWIERQLEKEILQYGLNCKKNIQVSQLSNSLKYVLELLRIKMFHPKYLIVDEVDANVNEFYKGIIAQILMDLKDSGTGILYITHQIERLIKMSDKISVLQDAHIINTVLREELQNGEIMDLFFSIATEHPPKTIIKPQQKILEFSHISNSKIKDFSMYVREGEIIGILGLEKEGPASIESIFFHEAHTHGDKHKGKTYLRENEVKIKTPQDALNAGVLLLDTNEIDKFLFADKPVYENMIPYSLKIKCRNRDKQKEICQAYLKKLSISAKPEDKIENISTGHQKKILIARNILSDGEVYILNNPTDNVDTISKIDIYNIINELKSRGNGIVLVSNDYHEIAGISDVVIVVQNGRIVRKYNNYSLNEKDMFEYK